MPVDRFGQILLQGDYEGTPLTVVETDAEGGNDLVEHVAYLRPGAELEFAGRRAERGKFQIAVLDGIGDQGIWQDRYVNILKTFRDHPIGQLTHPTHGIFDAGISRWRVHAAPEQRSGVYIDVEWIEHNATVQIEHSVLAVTDDDSPSSAVAQASLADDLGASTNARGNRIAPNYTEVSSTITEQLDFIESQQRTRSEIVASFKTMLDTVSDRLALPELDSASNHGLTSVLENLNSQILSLKTRYFPSFAQESIFLVPQTMAVWEVAQLMYNDAGLSSMVMANNSISDPFFIRAGRTLKILPLQ